MKLFLLTLALTGCAVSAFSGEDAVDAFLDEGVGLPDHSVIPVEEDVEADEDRFNFAKAIAKARKAAAKASPAQKKAFMNLARKAAKASPAQKKALMRKAYMKWKRKGEEAEEDVEEDEDLAWRAFAKIAMAKARKAAIAKAQKAAVAKAQKAAVAKAASPARKKALRARLARLRARLGKWKKRKGEQAEDEDVEEDEAQNLSQMLADDENEEDAEDLDVQGGQFLRKGRSSYGRSSRYSRSSRRRRSWGERRR